MFTNKSFNLLSFLVFSFCLYFFSFELDSNQNINSDETEIISDENNEEATEEEAQPENLEECMMQAESMMDAKRCEKEFMKTIEEFIEEEELQLIDGYMKIYTNDDNSVYFLKLDQEDLNNQFLYFLS